ncbi:Hsp70 suppressor, GTPase facilitates ribosomal subunit dissociation [Imshaugia aleurites]|uniref:Elongation factor 1 alpha-like protein n=1 Tax=Imshaugia aleurites TaxID=172621 RepID=A0A8H3IDM6_9LECA|nr:Hsp70 suppressor, GTPase facilitates ribosomal subunit dissociation [Imshaugia aleurites]
MSRHKLVKALDLDEELDDFDGGAESDYGEEIGAEDKEQLRVGTARVRDVLGPGVSIRDREIEDSLWHYYYDVDKTVDYLLGQRTNSQTPKKTKKQRTAAEVKQPDAPINSTQDWGTGDHITTSDTFSSWAAPFSTADFFSDCPWLNIPGDRHGDILIEPLYPRGGLLGGSSKSDGAPKSKLAALAAARKQKEIQKAEDGQNATNSAALLDKLIGKPRQLKPDGAPISSSGTPLSAITEQTVKEQPRKYPRRKSKRLESPEDDQPAKKTSQKLSCSASPEIEKPPEIIPTAGPSVFAQIIFGAPAGSQQHEVYTSDRYMLRPDTYTEFDFAGPSPDDVVTKAQNTKGPTKKPVKQPPQPPSGDQGVNAVAQSVGNVTIEEPLVKRKNLDVAAEFEKSKPKNAANFVVIGHVDAGKSTLMGRLLYDLKVVDQRTLDKYRKEAERIGKASFALAWVLDQGTEERNRGVTIDIAMNKFETKTTSFTILDAPGHRDFIPNMIAGASQADFAVLVIDASTGNFESGLKGQTKEHALLVRSMGVQRIVIAVNKLDTVQWSRDRFDEISQQISAFLTSAGFLAKNLAFVPCAGLTGDNIVRKAQDPHASWYTGAPLISLLESSEPVTRALEKPLRMTVDDIFRGGVQNPLSVSGRLDAGNVQIGDTVVIMPASQTATIRGLEVDSESSDWAVAGQNVVLHLADIEAKYLKSGDVVCPPSAPIRCVTSFTVKILAFEHITPMHCEVHKGRLHAPGRVTKLVAQLDKASGAAVKGKKPRLIKPGSVAKVLVEVDDPIPLEQGGKVILRAGGETIGAGLVE